MKRFSLRKKNSQNMTKKSPEALIFRAHADKIIIKLGPNNDLEFFVGNSIVTNVNLKGYFCSSKNQSVCNPKGNKKNDDVSNWHHRKKDDCKMISVVSAANYLISLFYNSDRHCRSAVIQKLLVIAQMRSLCEDNELLFSDDIVVKDSCFSIDFISKTYPNVIFDGEHREKDEILPDDALLVVEEETSNSTCFFKVNDMPDREKNILRTTYQRFGMYSGDSIGKVMCSLSLHRQYYQIGIIQSNTDLRNYLNSIPVEDMGNPIVNFVTFNAEI